MSETSTNTRDHHVPRMYLRRFARGRAGLRDRRQILAITTDLRKRFVTSINDVAVERGMYWGTDADGVPHHHLEEFLTSLEGGASEALRTVLDTGQFATDDALPPWPPPIAARHALSWWMAAQVLRTVRQRERLEVSQQPTGKDVPEQLTHLNLRTPFHRANRHIRYIAEMVEGLAAEVFLRPWGVGFSDYCLLTGDVPVLVLNGQDHPDQAASVRHWDLYLPLDPHRCLYLPGRSSAADPLTLVDHRFKLHPGHAIGLNSLMIDTAVRHVFVHPDHDPTTHAEPAVTGTGELPQFLLYYEILPDGYGVERRWLDNHPEPGSPSKPAKNDEELLALVEQMSAERTRRRDLLRPPTA